MSKTAESVSFDEQVSEPHFFNLFTGEFEPFLSEGHAHNRMFEAAAQRIAQQQEEIDRIKAYLVLD